MIACVSYCGDFYLKAGFRVSDAASEADARHLLQSIAFDLLIIDVMMPGQDGVSFLSELRPQNDVPAFVPDSIG